MKAPRLLILYRLPTVLFRQSSHRPGLSAGIVVGTHERVAKYRINRYVYLVCYQRTYSVTGGSLLSHSPTRRRLLRASSLGALAGVGGGDAEAALPSEPPPLPSAVSTIRFSLCGEWRFRTDARKPPTAHEVDFHPVPASAWRRVIVPHTWQVEPENAEYFGVAFYTRDFQVPMEWKNRRIRVEFEAVFHSAWVFVNGVLAGEHLGKGYTAFTLDITPHLKFGTRNTIDVRVDNSFSDNMLPRDKSSDWAPDGGIYRPVTLLVSPAAFVEGVAIHAVPSLHNDMATLSVTATLVNTELAVRGATVRCRILDETNGFSVLEWFTPEKRDLFRGSPEAFVMPPAILPRPRLWHCDRPHLYQLETQLWAGGMLIHVHRESFGIRLFEIRDGGFFLNGERIRPMGVERMAGSNPTFGMAEPEDWLRHDLEDLLTLNSVFTRSRWPLDRHILDLCDRHGILIQPELPIWDSNTFENSDSQAFADFSLNAIQQLREMITRDRNHPSIFAWGLGNEAGGQDPKAYPFAALLYREAKLMDPYRPCTYASHSLRETPGRDVARIMDFISWNEYHESRHGGTLETLRQNLEEIRAAFPGKPIVVSKYGYCACTAERPESDAQRIRILRQHTALFRGYPEIAGLIFFCYNDYRTHEGDCGEGVLKQRVRGVVDLFGNHKESFHVLRDESSPIEMLRAESKGKSLQVSLRTRETVPCWTLKGYRLRWRVFGPGNFAAEQGEHVLPDLSPGTALETTIVITTGRPLRIVVDVLRPAGISTKTASPRMLKAYG